MNYCKERTKQNRKEQKSTDEKTMYSGVLKNLLPN